MEISPVQIAKGEKTTKIQSAIHFSEQTKLLWFSVENQYTAYLTTEKLDAFLVAMLFPAMEAGEDIYVKGAISKKLYYNITNYFMAIICLIRPRFKKIRIFADSFSDGTEYNCAGKVVTGFSAGIDSFCTLYDHFTNEDTPDNFRITHLNFNNVGSHGRGDIVKAQKLFQARYQEIKGYPEEIGMEFMKIDSNLCEVVTFDFLFTVATHNVAAILLMQKMFSKYYLASAYRYKDIYIRDDHDIAKVDALVLHLLSTETLDCISSGCQYDRITKTEKITQVKGAEKYLNVCVSSDLVGGKNCSRCPKCLRTLFTLEMLGRLEQFDQVFDLDKWRKIRNWYIVHVILNKDDDLLTNEMREYAKEIGYPFSFLQITASYLHRIKNKFNPA